MKRKFNISTNESKGAKDAVMGMAFGNTDVDAQLDWVDFKLVPTPIKTILKIGKELMEWAVNDPSALKIRQFFRGRGIDRDTVYRWMERCPEFARMYKFALDAIGDRREILAFHKQASETMFVNLMGHYDPDYREYLKWKSSLATPINDNKQQIIVIEKTPDSPLVPVKGKQ